MTTMIFNTLSRVQRRSLARTAKSQVTAQGIQRSDSRDLMTCLIRLATQEQIPHLVQLDIATLEAMNQACRHEGSFYEGVRQELISRVSTSQKTDTAPPAYQAVIWTTEGQREYRNRLLTLWQRDTDNDTYAMLYALPCLPVECWHWRMYIWSKRGDVMTLPDILHTYALRKAGQQGLDCVVQGINFLDCEGHIQAKNRIEAPWDFDIEEDDPEELALFISCSRWER